MTRPARRPRRPPPPWLVRLVFLVALAGLWEWAARAGQIDPLDAPPPLEILGNLDDVVFTEVFLDHFRRTAASVLTAFGIGLTAGVVLGVLFWKARSVGDALEPYFVTMYAMPTLVFYPILLAIMGLNAGPIVTITVVFVIVPVAVSTMIALRSIEPTLLKLAASLRMSPLQRYRKVIVPAATPLAIPGVKLGFIYSVVATIAMEFILATRGLGFMISVTYEEFQIVTMYSYIAVVVGLSVLVNSSLSLVERKVRRDML